MFVVLRLGGGGGDIIFVVKYIPLKGTSWVVEQH